VSKGIPRARVGLVLRFNHTHLILQQRFELYVFVLLLPGLMVRALGNAVALQVVLDDPDGILVAQLRAR